MRVRERLGDRRRPIAVLSEYLGAGKATPSNPVLHNREGKRVAVIVDDMSEIPIDAARSDTMVTVGDTAHPLRDYGFAGFPGDRGRSPGDTNARALVDPFPIRRCGDKGGTG